MRHNKHLKSVICIIMSLLMVFSVVFGVGAVEEDIAQTGATTTVYFRNTANWSSVYAYVWVKDTSTSIKAWPGEAMTLHEGNIYKYTVNGDYNMIIFNNGGNGSQTDDLNLAQDGYLFDYSTKTWEKYAEPTPTQPTTEPTPTQPTTPPETQLVYFKNTGSWSSVYCYMWKNGAGNNGSWPGKPMTNVGEDIWQYEVTGDFDMIIFNVGSDSQKTGDLSFPGGGYIYDYTANKWEVYDTSPITVKSTSTDLASPQYKGSEITLTADATSTGGTVYYKFSVKDPSGRIGVLNDYSTSSTAKWSASSVGTYTLIYDFKDDKGNENQRTVTYKIEDDSNLVKPVIKKVIPEHSQVKKGSVMNIVVTAGGGKTGTNLLFYKYTVKDASGKVLNVPYYAKSNTYNYTPNVLGKFTVTVSVQNSDNDVVERTYTFESVTNPTDPIEPSTPTTPVDPSGVIGDADSDGVVTILDATLIQMFKASLPAGNKINLALADYDGDGQVSVLDATAIQLWLAKV